MRRVTSPRHARPRTRDEADLAGGGYEQVALTAMSALLRDEPSELILNVRNGTTVPQLPADAVIEIPARVISRGAAALPVGELVPHQLGRMSQVKGVEQDVIAVVGRYALRCP